MTSLYMSLSLTSSPQSLYCILSYHIPSYRIVSYRIVLYCIVSYHNTSHRIVLYCIVLYPIITHRTVGNPTKRKIYPHFIYEVKGESSGWGHPSSLDAGTYVRGWWILVIICIHGFDLCFLLLWHMHQSPNWKDSCKMGYSTTTLSFDFVNKVWIHFSPRWASYNTIYYDRIQYNTIQCDTIQYDTMGCDMIGYNIMTEGMM